MFVGDANNCFEATLYKDKNLLLAKRYWNNCPNEDGVPSVKEILVNCDIKVIEIIREINANV